MATIFDKIISGEIPCYKVWEDDNYLAFLDISPRCVGHTLVIPKQPHDYLFDMDDAGLAGLMTASRTVAEILKEKLGCKRVCVGVWGFEVAHVHIHLMPANSIDDAAPPPQIETNDEALKALHAKLTSG